MNSRNALMRPAGNQRFPGPGVNERHVQVDEEERLQAVKRSARV